MWLGSSFKGYIRDSKLATVDFAVQNRMSPTAEWLPAIGGM
jgi:hypothetical protein